MNTNTEEIKTIVMHPNEKPPLASFEGWKPSDGYIENKPPKFAHRVIILLGLIASGIGLVAWSQV